MQPSSPGVRLSVVGVVRQIWLLLWQTFIEFVWSDLRHGMIDLRELSRPVRAILLLGILITVVGLLLLTQTPLLRSTFPLYTSITPAPGRGLHIPILLFPLSLFLLTLAWAYLLVGARQSHWFIRTTVFLFYALSVAGWLVPLLATNLREVVVSVLLNVAILLIYLLPLAKRVNPTNCFILFLVCVGSSFVIVQYLLIQQDQASGLPIGKTLLESNLRSLVTVAIPLLILIGIDIADFAIHAAKWVNQAATTFLPIWWRAGLTFILLAWLLCQGASFFPFATYQSFHLASLFPLIGASALLLILWLTWSLLARLFPLQLTLTIESYALAVGKVALGIVLALLLPLLTSFLFLEVAQVLKSLAVELNSGFYGDFSLFDQWASSIYATATTFSATVLHFQSQWQILTSIAVIIFSLLLYRRNQPAPALFAMTFAINYLCVEITRPGRWLQSFGWTSAEAITFTWAIYLLFWAIVLQWRRKLIPARLSNLLLACLILTLLRQTDLIASPLDTLFALAGVGYLAVGLGWDLLTAGSWTDLETPSLPRISRLFLYVGYVLLTVMLINWAVASHDFTMLSRLTGEAALTGLVLLGYPYLFSSLYLLLASQDHSSNG